MNLSHYFETIRYLKPKQIIGQVKSKLFHAETYPSGWTFVDVPQVNNNNFVISSLDEDKCFLKRFNVDEILNGKITLLYETKDFSGKKWDYPECTPLWNFNLHYFEYAIALAHEYKVTGNRRCAERFIELYNSWLSCPSPSAYHSYTISLRIRNLLIAQQLFGSALPQDFQQKLMQTVYAQYCFLKTHLETAILGNHYFENLCTLTLCSILFDDGIEFPKWNTLFYAEVREQMLPDGVHFERSLMYHKLMMEDLIRTVSILQQSTHEEWKNYLPYIQRGLNAMVSLESGSERTLLFNDSGDNVAKPVVALQTACKTLFSIEPNYRRDFVDAGYYVLQNKKLLAVVDAGSIGPDYIPGHVQCDALSFELFLNGIPLFVNSGTGQYQGVLRQYFRSTKAHNTVVINGHEQSECWAEHRVARRLKSVSANWTDSNILDCECENYLAEMHHRKIVINETSFEVSDTTRSTEQAKIESYLHIAPEFSVYEKAGTFTIWRGTEYVGQIISNRCSGKMSQASYAPEFGKVEEATVLCFLWVQDDRSHGYKFVMDKEK